MNSGGTVTGGGWYPAGSNVTLTATPDAGYQFAGWNDGITNVSRLVEMPQYSASYTATFSPIPHGYLHFQKSAYSVEEFKGSVKLTVDRVGGSYGPATVEFVAASGTASVGVDFSLDSGILSWTNGETKAKSLYVDIIDDSNHEGNETFTVGLTNATGASIDSSSVANVTIIDDDCAPSRVVRFIGDLDFGAVATNMTATRFVEVWNDGNQPLSVTAVTVPAGFTASPQSFSLSPAESCSISVSFAPLTTNNYSGVLSLTCDATTGSTSLAVFGTGVVPVPPVAIRSIQGLTAVIAVVVTNPAVCIGVEDELESGLSVTSISDGGTWDAINHKVKWFFNAPGQVRSRALQYTVNFAGSVVTGAVNFGSGNLPIIGATVFNGDPNPGILHPADVNGNWRLTLDEVAAHVARWRTGTDWDKTPVVVRGITLYLQGESYYYDACEHSEAKRWKTLTGDLSPKMTAEQTGKIRASEGAFVTPLAGATSSAVRSVQTTNVTITVTPVSGTQAWGMEEAIPAGIEVNNVSDGGTWDATHLRIKWAFFDGNARTLSYSVTGVAGAHGVVGQISFDGSDEAVVGATSFGVPLPFATWVLRNGITGDEVAAFVARNPVYNQPNGLIYALQSGMQPGDQFLEIRFVNGVPMIEIPVQDPSTIPFVDLHLEGTTDIKSGDWNMSLTPAPTQEGLSGNRCRWVPLGDPSNACFRLRTTTK